MCSSSRRNFCPEGHEAMRQELVLCLTGTFEGLAGLKER